MKETWKIPYLDNRNVCITDINSVELCAAVSSCFARKDHYLPLFVFPDVNTLAKDDYDSQSDGYISHMIGSETATLINNAVVNMSGCERVIYVGLNENQKSYLKRFRLSEQIVEIDSLDDLRSKFTALSLLPSSELHCKKEQLLEGLYLASVREQLLVVDSNAPDLMLDDRGDADGLVTVEKDRRGFAFPITAANYAISIGADFKVVQELSENEERSVGDHLQKWESSRNQSQLNKVLKKVRDRVGDIDFNKYKYVTFFTNGLPYSLGIKNSIPCTHVHLSLRPDFFICNSIGVETGGRYHSAVVFSPQFFADEETDMVVKTLTQKNYFVRPLLGKQATSHNLDFHVQFFPYDFLHICSHGGEIGGYEVEEKYKDRAGVEHTVEYYEAVSFAPVPGKDLIGVAQKIFFNKFDGFKWMSPELKAQKLPDYVFQDMQKVLFSKEGPSKNAKRTQKEKIPTACAIKCIDDFHQGAFRILASQHSPIIFNNSCLSWGEISRFFIIAGARGYIGTLWSVGNREAVKTAEVFYSSISNTSIMTSLHNALQSIRGTKSEDIYLYWGLHFTSLNADGISLSKSRGNVFSKLVQSFLAYSKKVKETKNEEVRKNYIRVADDVRRHLIENYSMEDFEDLNKKFEKFKDIRSDEKRTAVEESIKIQDTPSLKREFVEKRIKI